MVEDGQFPNLSHKYLNEVDTTTFYDADNLKVPMLTFDAADTSWGGQTKDAVGEDSEATVASVLYQVASAGSFQNNDAYVFRLMSRIYPFTLEQFFAAGAPSIAENAQDPFAAFSAWATIFQNDGATPLNLTATGLNNPIPKFVFQIPATRTTDERFGPRLGRDDAFNSFQIVIYNSSGTLFCAKPDPDARSRGPRNLPDRAGTFCRGNNLSRRGSGGRE